MDEGSCALAIKDTSFYAYSCR